MVVNVLQALSGMPNAGQSFINAINAGMNLRKEMLTNQMLAEQANMMPQHEQAELHAQNLANSLKEFQLQHAPEQLEMALGAGAGRQKLTEAQTAYWQQKAKDATSGLLTTTLAGADPVTKLRVRTKLLQAKASQLGIEKGMDSSEYKDALKDAQDSQGDLQRQIDSQNALISYRQGLQKALPRRFLTTIGKAKIEQRAVAAGLPPTADPETPTTPAQQLTTPSTQQAVPQTSAQEGVTPSGYGGLHEADSLVQPPAQVAAKQQQNIPYTQTDVDHYTAFISAHSGMADNLKKLTSAAQAEQALLPLMQNKWAMAYYSGVKGRAKLAIDTAQAQLPGGKVTPALAAYNRFLTSVPILASQLRQYYGASVQKAQMAEYETISNPATWKTSPKLALIRFNQAMQLLNNEINARKSIVTGPGILWRKGTLQDKLLQRDNDENKNIIEAAYTGKPPKVARGTPSAQETVLMQDKNGKYWYVPSDKIDQALKMGARRVQ